MPWAWCLFEMLTGERPSGAELPSELNPEVPVGWMMRFENHTLGVNAALNQPRLFSTPSLRPAQQFRRPASCRSHPLLRPTAR